MRPDYLIADTLSRLIGRFVRRAVAVLVFAVLLLAAVYQVTAAGTLVLGDAYGMVNARLIIVGVFAAAALGVLGFLIATRAKVDATADKLQPGTMGIAMLLETLLLGYALGRGKSRSTLERT